jgi:hypothetical protein
MRLTGAPRLLLRHMPTEEGLAFKHWPGARDQKLEPGTITWGCTVLPCESPWVKKISYPEAGNRTRPWRLSLSRRPDKRLWVRGQDLRWCHLWCYRKRALIGNPLPRVPDNRCCSRNLDGAEEDVDGCGR